MQGRKPDPFILKKRDVPILQQLLRDGQTSQRIARRARILLNRARDQRVNQVRLKVDRAASTVWRVCERYRLHGLDAALYDAPRSGRPLVYAPRVRKRIGELGLYQARDRGLAPLALVYSQPRTGRHRAGNCCPHPLYDDQ